MDLFIISLAGLLLVFGFIAYIKALVNAAQNGKWAWFVLILLFWPIFFFYYMGAYRKPELLNDSAAALDRREGFGLEANSGSEDTALRAANCVAYLREKGYRPKQRSGGWVIVEPYGGRVRVHSIDELESYARSRVAT